MVRDSLVDLHGLSGQLKPMDAAQDAARFLDVTYGQINGELEDVLGALRREIDAENSRLDSARQVAAEVDELMVHLEKANDPEEVQDCLIRVPDLHSRLGELKTQFAIMPEHNVVQPSPSPQFDVMEAKLSTVLPTAGKDQARARNIELLEAKVFSLAEGPLSYEAILKVENELQSTPLNYEKKQELGAKIAEVKKESQRKDKVLRYACLHC